MLVFHSVVYLIKLILSLNLLCNPIDMIYWLTVQDGDRYHNQQYILNSMAFKLLYLGHPIKKLPAQELSWQC